MVRQWFFKIAMLAVAWSCSCCGTPAPAAPAPLVKRVKAGAFQMPGVWDLTWNQTTWRYTFTSDGKCESAGGTWKGEWRLDGRVLYVTESTGFHDLIWSCSLDGREAMIHTSNYSSEKDRRIPCTIVRIGD